MELGRWLVGTGGAGAAGADESNAYLSLTQSQIVYVGTHTGSSLLPPVELSHSKVPRRRFAHSPDRCLCGGFLLLSVTGLHVRSKESGTQLWGVSITADGKRALTNSHSMKVRQETARVTNRQEHTI